MDIASIAGNAATAAMVRQLQTVAEMQTAIMSQMAAGEQQLAEMLAAMGIGQHIDIRA